MNIIQEIEEEKKQGKRIVFTNGCFDIIHVGHVTYLKKAKDLGDILVIGLNSDSSVKKLKGPSRPINNQDDRAIVLSALKFVDYIIIFEEETPLKLVKSITPDIIVKGGDYKEEDVVGGEFIQSIGGKVIIIPFVDGKSTTNIINKMKSDEN